MPFSVFVAGFELEKLLEMGDLRIGKSLLLHLFDEATKRARPHMHHLKAKGGEETCGKIHLYF